jgi:predicted Zn-dependent protease
MLQTLVAAIALSSSGGPSCCVEPSGRIGAIVEAAWREAGQQDPQPKLTKEQQKHAEDLKNDVEIGAKYAAQADKELKASTNQEHIDRVNRITAELTAIANQQKVKVLWGDSRLNTFTYRFKVVEKDEVNAFSLPGGYIYVYDGLLKYVESDDELAGVLAHEIAHASFRHLATLQREQSKLDALTLPLILVSIMAGGDAGVGGVQLAQLASIAKQSGWSQKAEIAADFGAFQYLRSTKYNPVGLLTFMEKLARDQRVEYIDWGIYRTHPPSRERAESIEKYLREANIPIKRSQVTTSFRVTTKELEKGEGVELLFNKRRLFVLGGANAGERAKDLLPKLNDFFDSVPELFDVQMADSGSITYRKRELVKFTPEDAAVAGSNVSEVSATALRSIKRELFVLAFRIWDAR